MPNYVTDGSGGLIVHGREVKTNFTSVDQIDAICATVDRLEKKYKLKLGFVYCGTTINWSDPEQIDFPALVGIVTYDCVKKDGFVSIPTSAFSPQKVPAQVWAELSEKHDLAFSDADATYLAVVGWAHASIQGADKEAICSVRMDESTAYRRIDNEPQIMSGAKLTMFLSGC